MKQESKEWLLKLTSIGIIVILWVVFFIWKNKNPDQDTGIFLIILGISSVAGVIYFFKEKLSKLFPKNKDEIPEPLSEPKIREIIEKEADENWDNDIKLGKPYEWKISETINKNQIYARKVNLNLDDESFIIILNASYPQVSPSVYPPYRITEEGKKIRLDKDDAYLRKLMNAKSINPDQEPDVIRTRETIDQFRNPTREVEEIKHKPKEEKKEEVA